MDKPTVYLAGPLTGRSYAECQNWRIKVESQLMPYGIACFNPLRGQDLLSDEDELQSGYDHYLVTEKAITCRDYWDVSRADVVLVNLLGAETVSVGSVMEIAWAYVFRKPLIVVMENDNVHQHGMIKTVAWYILDNLDAAVELIVDLVGSR